MLQKQKQTTCQRLTTPVKIHESQHRSILNLENDLIDILHGKVPFNEDTLKENEINFIKVLICIKEGLNNATKEWEGFAKSIYTCLINKEALEIIIAGKSYFKSTPSKNESTTPSQGDKEDVPVPENAIVISENLNAAKSNTFSKFTDIMLKKYGTDEIYVRLLGQYNLYDGLVRGVISRRKRRQVKLEYRVLTAQIKLLEIAYVDLIKRCHQILNGQRHESILKMVQQFKFKSSRMRTNIQRITDCIQAKKRVVSEKKIELCEIELQLEETKRQLESACNEFEELSKTSVEYEKALQMNEQLASEMEQVEIVNRRDAMELSKLNERLHDMRFKLVKHDEYTKDLKARREAIESRSTAWKRRETTQESLKEIIRMKTGIILREEDILSRLKKSIEKFQAEKRLLCESIDNLKLQRKKMMSKYHKFTMGCHGSYDRKIYDVSSLLYLNKVC